MQRYVQINIRSQTLSLVEAQDLFSRLIVSKAPVHNFSTIHEDHVVSLFAFF